MSTLPVKSSAPATTTRMSPSEKARPARRRATPAGSSDASADTVTEKMAPSAMKAPASTPSVSIVSVSCPALRTPVASARAAIWGGSRASKDSACWEGSALPGRVERPCDPRTSSPASVMPLPCCSAEPSRPRCDRLASLGSRGRVCGAGAGPVVGCGCHARSRCDPVAEPTPRVGIDRRAGRTSGWRSSVSRSLARPDIRRGAGPRNRLGETSASLVGPAPSPIATFEVGTAPGRWVEDRVSTECRNVAPEEAENRIRCAKISCRRQCIRFTQVLVRRPVRVPRRSQAPHWCWPPRGQP